MLNSSVKITVFTPTYNRVGLIKNLYKSLLRQSCKDFEWVIVDDGSSDDTEVLVESWLCKSNNFDITYVKVQNGGKHRAINKGIDISNGELFYIVDSDDYIMDDAIERVIKWESTIASSKEKYAGIAGAKGFDEYTIIGSNFNDKWIDATSLDREKFNIKGDKAEIFYTEVLKNNKFPEFDGEKFITESVVWYKIANCNLKIRWFNEIISICEYQDSGLSNQGEKLFYDNPIGALYSLKNEIGYKQFSFKRRAYAVNKYIKIATKGGKSLSEISNDLNISCFLLKCIRELYKIKEMR